MSRLILGSISPRRAELLHSLGVEFEVVPGSAEELHDDSIDPERLCELNAERKAVEVARRHPDAIVLAADTLVFLERELFGKPRDVAEAKMMLGRLGGKTHRVVTGVCLESSGRKSVFSDVTEVRFRSLSLEQIEEYIAAVPVLDKAGAYGIQDRGEWLVESITGSYSNVMGLPLERLAREFDAWGIPYKSRKR